MDLSKLDLTIKTEKLEDDRKDPTSFLPEELMSYEIKAKKKKKKKKRQEDPFKDINEKPLVTEMVVDLESETCVDPEVNIKVENIEVELDFNDFANTETMADDQDYVDAEPEIKLEQDNKEAFLLTYENVVSDNRMVHIPTVPPAENLICSLCYLVFGSEKTLLKHQKSKHKSCRVGFNHVCDDCGMEYERKNSLMVHIRRKHGPDAKRDDGKECVCDICALVFKGQSRLRLHMKRKHDAYVESFKHKCKYCSMTYENYSSLVVHIKRKHGAKKPVKHVLLNCPFCEKIFNKRETYTRHVQRSHQVTEDGEVKNSNSDKWGQRNAGGEITCKECPLVFASPTYLKLHMRRKHNALQEDFKLKCRICNLSYSKIESLKRHVRRKHDQGTYCAICNKDFDTVELCNEHTHVKPVQECSICGSIFANRGVLAGHLRSVHKIDKPKVVFCNLCNKGFHDKRQLKPHHMNEHLKISYTCKYCKKVYKSRETYTKHILCQHPDANIVKLVMQKCEQCTEQFTDEFELCKHINIVHYKSGTVKTEDDVKIKKEEDNKNTFLCTKCPETYKSWEELKSHYEKNHYVVKNTQCQVCGQIVPHTELPKHTKEMHSKNKEEQCKYCDFKSNVRGSMTQHMLRHKNATTIHCEFPECKYNTFYEHAMQKHKLKHKELGVKYHCSQCTFQTMNKYILKYHEEAHFTGKKKYACNQCDYSTVLPANLVQHKYKHATEKRFKCEVCPFATKYNTSLRWHVKKKHCDLPSLS